MTRFPRFTVRSDRAAVGPDERHLPTELYDPTTGERLVFDEAASSDERLVWEGWRPADEDPPPAHAHPDTEERFSVLEGHLLVRLDGVTYRVDAGEERVVPARTPHVSYTGEEPARFRREVTPPGRWRPFLTDQFAASHAEDDQSGFRKVLQVVLLLRAYPDVVVAAFPPRPVQRVLFPLLAAIARTTGLRAHYPYPRGTEGGCR